MKTQLVIVSFFIALISLATVAFSFSEAPMPKMTFVNNASKNNALQHGFEQNQQSHREDQAANRPNRSTSNVESSMEDDVRAELG